MFQVGQKVWCAIYGEGVVEDIQHPSEGTYPVVARFDNTLGVSFTVSYTRDGKPYTAGNVTLFTYPVEIVKAITKPSIDWNHVSEDFQWLAMDEVGLHHLFAEKPRLITSEWATDGLYTYAEHFASFIHGTCNWKDSLVKRPE